MKQPHSQYDTHKSLKIQSKHTDNTDNSSLTNETTRKRGILLFQYYTYSPGSYRAFEFFMYFSRKLAPPTPKFRCFFWMVAPRFRIFQVFPQGATNTTIYIQAPFLLLT